MIPIALNHACAIYLGITMLEKCSFVICTQQHKLFIADAESPNLYFYVQ